MKHAAPIFATLLLLLPLLYVGSYLALVDRAGNSLIGHYRHGGRWAERIYWPLEQVGRKLFPARWPEPIRFDF